MTPQEKLAEIEESTYKERGWYAVISWEDIEFLIERTKTLEAALEFYGEEGVWNWHYCKKEFAKGNKCYAVSDEIQQDGGEIARKALKGGEE